VKELLQLLPPSLEYSMIASASMPEVVKAPLLVMWSVAELPLSVTSASVGDPEAIALHHVAGDLVEGGAKRSRRPLREASHNLITGRGAEHALALPSLGGLARW
jgi:hypothetical protein